MVRDKAELLLLRAHELEPLCFWQIIHQSYVLLMCGSELNAGYECIRSVSSRWTVDNEHLCITEYNIEQF